MLCCIDPLLNLVLKFAASCAEGLEFGTELSFVVPEWLEWSLDKLGCRIPIREIYARSGLKQVRAIEYCN